MNATTSGLAVVNSAGNAVIRVDDESYVPLNEKRNSVRITSQEYFNFGSLWVIDMVHMPFGCSVSLSFSFFLACIPFVTTAMGPVHRPSAFRLIVELGPLPARLTTPHACCILGY